MSEVTVDAGVAGAVHTPIEQDTAMETTVEAAQEPGSEPQEPEQSISRSPSSDSHVRSSVSDSQVGLYPGRHRKRKGSNQERIEFCICIFVFFCLCMFSYCMVPFFICPFLYRSAREECHRLSDHLLLVMSLLRIHVTSYFRVGVCIEVVVSCVVGLPLP